MKVSEVISPTKSVLNVQPSAVNQQQRVAKVVQQIAASDQQQQPSEMEKVLALRQMSAKQKQADKNYASQLRQQLAIVDTQRRGRI
jgi:hypothetical protein